MDAYYALPFDEYINSLHVAAEKRDPFCPAESFFFVEAFPVAIGEAEVLLGQDVKLPTDGKMLEYRAGSSYSVSKGTLHKPNAGVDLLGIPTGRKYAFRELQNLQVMGAYRVQHGWKKELLRASLDKMKAGYKDILVSPLTLADLRNSHPTNDAPWFLEVFPPVHDHYPSLKVRVYLAYTEDHSAGRRHRWACDKGHWYENRDSESSCDYRDWVFAGTAHAVGGFCRGGGVIYMVMQVLDDVTTSSVCSL